MIRSTLMAVSESIVKDSDSNSISILNIIEDVVLESFPIVMPKFATTVFFQKDGTDPDIFNLTLFVRNNNTLLIQHPMRLDFKGKTRNRAIVRFGGILLNEMGTLRFSVEDGTSEICTYTISLTLRDNVQVAYAAPSTSNPPQGEA